VSWNPLWERIFHDRESWGRYPPEELIRFVAAHYYSVPSRKDVSFLEIGCGPGAGPSWYIAREGFRFAGIDGSTTAIEKSRARFASEGLVGVFEVGDLRSLPWPAASFDCVVDVAALQHNDEAAAAVIAGEVHRVLKPSGRHFSLTAKAGCWGDGTGDHVDATARRNVTEGPYVGTGIIRFATRDSLARLYASFRELVIDYSIRSVVNGAREVANWVVAAQR
jgi:SAM-dependent methyltransferase